MHDKEEHLFDNEFTDHAWSEMQKLLDEEMPLVSKRHRLSWLLALGLVVLTGPGWLFGPSSNVFRFTGLNQFPVAVQIDEPISEFLPIDQSKDLSILSKKTSPVENESAISEYKKIIEPGENKEIASSLMDDGTASTSPMPSPVAVDPILQKDQLELQATDMGTKSEQINDFSSADPLLSSHAQHTSVKDQVESDNFIMEVKERNSESVAALFFLPQKTKELQWPLRKTPESIEFKSKVRPSASNWNWGVQTALLDSQVPDFSGWSLGVWGQRPRFFTPRLALRVGLQYQQTSISPVASTRSKDDLNAGFNSENTDPGTGFPPGRQQDVVTAVDAANRLDLSVRQFQLPVSLRWRLNPKLTASGGIQLSYRKVNIRNIQAIDQNVSLSSVDQSGVYAKLVSLDPGTAFPAKNVNRWDVGANVGLSYQLGNRLEAMVSYQYGFSNLFKDLDLQNYNRNLGIGFSYRFGKK